MGCAPRWAQISDARGENAKQRERAAQLAQPPGFLLPHDPRDDEIRGTALQLLTRDPRVRETTVDVAVADGWFTLQGEVRHQHESDAAFEDVAQLESVGGITTRSRS